MNCKNSISSVRYIVIGSFILNVTHDVSLQAAHHSDLRVSEPSDPTTVIAARALEKATIKLWLTQNIILN